MERESPEELGPNMLNLIEELWTDRSHCGPKGAISILSCTCPAIHTF